MVALERLTDRFYIYVKQAEQSHYFISETYIKSPGKPYILHRVCSFRDMPTIADILEEAERNHIKSCRPYKAGQPCDGSISSPVFHLYNQLCNHLGLDPIIVHGAAYSDIHFKINRKAN